jgi:hypothetical protein
MVRMKEFLAKYFAPFLAKYFAHFLALGCITLISFLVGVASAIAANDERDKAQDDRITAQDHQVELLRKENREDHRRIEERLDLLLRQAPLSRDAVAKGANHGG